MARKNPELLAIPKVKFKGTKGKRSGRQL